MRTFCLTIIAAVALALLLAGSVSARPDGPPSTTDPTQRDFERYFARMQPLIERYGYGAIAAAVIAEGVGVPAPGQALMIAGAFEAAQGRMSIAWLLLLTTASAIVGNSIGYALGRWGGRAVLAKLIINSRRQQRLEDIFNRRGGVVILLGRFIDGLRQLNGVFAGIMRMPWSTFTLYNGAGALLWTCAWTLGTYYVGRDTHVIAAYLHRHRCSLYALGAAALLALLVWLLYPKLMKSGSAIHR
jgi:membrane protein DedA with SNARE-associated domain